MLGASVAALTLAFNLAMPHRIRLIGVALLFIPQIYVPGMPVTLFALWTIYTCIFGLITRERVRANSPLIPIMGAFLAATASSLLWATAEGMSEGMSTVVRGALFLLWLREIIVVAKDDPRMLDTIVMWSAPGLAVQAVLSIIFRFSAALEEQFLQSPLARYTIGPGVERLYTDMWNNVLDVGKSGGFFINGNMASMLGGVGALVLLITARRTGRRSLYLCASLSMAGSLCTGSKTAIIVTALCAVAIAFLPHALKGWTLILSIPVALVIPLTLSAILDVVSGIFPGLYNASDSSIGARQILWNSAGRLFAESPFMGLGFGGWEEQVNRRYPPHNFIIAAWAYSGVVAAIVVVAFVVASLVVALRVAAAQSTVYHRRTAILALCAIAWVFLHGMADNTSVYGEQRSMFLFALAFGYLYAMKHQSQEQAENPVRTTNGAPLPARISDRTSLTGLRAHR